MVNHLLGVLVRDVPQHQDGQVDAAAAQVQGLVQHGHRQHVHAGVFLQHTGHAHVPAAVAVALDHAAQLHPAQHLAQGLYVVQDGANIDLDHQGSILSL